jgi:hypothetical protein
MSPLSEHERRVLKELEISLLVESNDPLHLTAQDEYKRHRRGAIAGACTFLIGAAIMIVFLTQQLAVSVAGLFVLIAGSLFFAHQIQLANRASKMTELPPTDQPTS